MIQAVVTDIEGTTSSLSFVKRTLFPYARRYLPDYVRAHAEDLRVRELLDDVRSEAGQGDLSVEQCVDCLQGWMEQDAKVTPLKHLQGLVWEAGYRRGDFRGHVYADAVDMLRRWHSEGIRLYVYSSGSVQAQKLLFSHTGYGDLTGLFHGYFDTRTGPKKQADSYRRIAETIDTQPEALLFLSDDVAELDAASQAGWHTVQLIRPGEAQPGFATAEPGYAPASRGGHTAAEDFYMIDLKRIEA